MTRRRFVVGEDLALSADQARQIASVLRLGPGDVVVLVSPFEEIDYRLVRVSATSVEGTVLARRSVDAEPRRALTLGLPLLRGEHTELVIESATQLGVQRFVPYVSARSVVRDVSAGKRGRWERIAREAVETSRRARVPEIAALVPWDTLFEALDGRVLVAWEEEREVDLADTLTAGPGAVSLVIGPEGGLAAEEIALARAAGATTVSLGRRPLRAETAAIAGVSRIVAGLDR
ncbi:16S rRNA (uracil(1498)-N(3))-methyltransferase [soil metagenome]